MIKWRDQKKKVEKRSLQQRAGEELRWNQG